MRGVIVGVLVAAAVSCARTDMGASYATALVALARERQIDATASGARVTLAGVNVNVRAQIEQERRLGPKWAVGVAVETSLPDGARLTTGSVGIGDSRQDALETAVTEWVLLAGTAILNAMSSKERPSEVIVRSGLRLYPGALSIRGSEQPPWSEDQHGRLVDLITPALMDLAPGRLHDLSLTVGVSPTGEVDGECRLDGTRMQSLLSAVQTLSWPKRTTAYIVKRYYLVERTDRPPHIGLQPAPADGR